jgi:hypothetical protein
VPYLPPAFYLQIGQRYFSGIHVRQARPVDVINDPLVQQRRGQFRDSSLAASAQAISRVTDRSGGGTCTSTRANTISDSLLDKYCVKPLHVLHGKRLQYMMHYGVILLYC